MPGVAEIPSSVIPARRSAVPEFPRNEWMQAFGLAALSRQMLHGRNETRPFFKVNEGFWFDDNFLIKNKLSLH